MFIHMYYSTLIKFNVFRFGFIIDILWSSYFWNLYNSLRLTFQIPHFWMILIKDIKVCIITDPGWFLNYWWLKLNYKRHVSVGICLSSNKFNTYATDTVWLRYNLFKRIYLPHLSMSTMDILFNIYKVQTKIHHEQHCRWNYEKSEQVLLGIRHQR